MEQLITVLIALYGAVLSSALAVREWRKGRPCVRVTVRQGHLHDAMGPSEPVLMLEAVNVGAGKVHFDEIGFLYSDKTRGALARPYQTPLPLTLEERSRHTVPYACRFFKENLSDRDAVGVYFKDQTGHFWQAKVTSQQQRSWLDVPSGGWQVE